MVNLKSYNKNDEIKELLEIFIKDDTKGLGGSVAMDEAVNELERLSQDENIIGLYDAELLQEKHEKSIKNEGIREGLKKGLEKGKVEGINQSKIEIAKKMLEKDMDINTISELTNLSIYEIKEL